MENNKLLKQLWEQVYNDRQVMVSLRRNAEHSEPMYAQIDKKDNKHIWFFMEKDNRVAEGGKTTIQFVSKEHKLFASMIGQLATEKDDKRKNQFWTNATEAWFKDGIEDSKLQMMRFELESAEIWEKNPSVTGLIKLATGAYIEPDEMGEHELVEVE